MYYNHDITIDALMIKKKRVDYVMVTGTIGGTKIAMLNLYTLNEDVQIYLRT